MIADKDCVHVNYSMKNIALPSKDAYRRNLIGKVERVIKRMRWKAHFSFTVDPATAQQLTSLV